RRVLFRSARIVRRALGSKFANKRALHLREASNTAILVSDLAGLLDFLTRVSGLRPAKINDFDDFAARGYVNFIVTPAAVIYDDHTNDTKRDLRGIRGLVNAKLSAKDAIT